MFVVCCVIDVPLVIVCGLSRVVCCLLVVLVFVVVCCLLCVGSLFGVWSLTFDINCCLLLVLCWRFLRCIGVLVVWCVLFVILCCVLFACRWLVVSSVCLCVCLWFVD